MYFRWSISLSTVHFWPVMLKYIYLLVSLELIDYSFLYAKNQSLQTLLFISISKTFLVDLLPAGSLLFREDSPAKFRNSVLWMMVVLELLVTRYGRPNWWNLHSNAHVFYSNKNAYSIYSLLILCIMIYKPICHNFGAYM